MTISPRAETRARSHLASIIRSRWRSMTIAVRARRTGLRRPRVEVRQDGPIRAPSEICIHVSDMPSRCLARRYLHSSTLSHARPVSIAHHGLRRGAQGFSRFVDARSCQAPQLDDLSARRIPLRESSQGIVELQSSARACASRLTRRLKRRELELDRDALRSTASGNQSSGRNNFRSIASVMARWPRSFGCT